MAAEADSTLAGSFAPATEEQWLAAVDKVLKGAPFDRLVSHTDDDIAVAPLYGRDRAPGRDDEAGFPGVAPYTRGATAAPRPNGAWDVRASIRCTDPETANRSALAELERGSTSLLLERPDSASLGAILEGVHLELAPIVLRPGAAFSELAEGLTALWSERGVDPADALGGFGADPLGDAGFEPGESEAALSSALSDVGTLAAATARSHPAVRTISLSTLSYMDSGASEAQELAAMLCTGVAYLRTLSSAGLSIDDACGQIEITLGVDANVFRSIAKLRAARRVWSNMTAAIGASTARQAPRIYAHTSRRMLTKRDPWVNLLRVTAATFAAGIGGVEGLTTDSFDVLTGESGALGTRMARNTQLLLLEESNLGRVLDPAGGSSYVESLTDELAISAWAQFQGLEAAGGFPTVLLDGTLAGRIAEVRSRRLQQVATRRQPITGVSEFPSLFEAPLRSPDDAAGPDVAGAGSVRWAQGFEALRDQADEYRRSHNGFPKVFLVNLGPVAEHTARATFAKNFFEAGGIEAVTSERGSTTGFDDAASAVADFGASGASLACICSSDSRYAEAAVAFAEALRDGGAERLYLAGNPGERRDAETAAGVNEFIHVGVNVLDVLQRAHEVLGLTRQEVS